MLLLCLEVYLLVVVGSWGAILSVSAGFRIGVEFRACSCCDCVVSAFALLECIFGAGLRRFFIIIGFLFRRIHDVACLRQRRFVGVEVQVVTAKPLGRIALGILVRSRINLKVDEPIRSFAVQDGREIIIIHQEVVRSCVSSYLSSQTWTLIQLLKDLGNAHFRLNRCLWFLCLPRRRFVSRDTHLASCASLLLSYGWLALLSHVLFNIFIEIIQILLYFHMFINFNSLFETFLDDFGPFLLFNEPGYTC